MLQNHEHAHRLQQKLRDVQAFQLIYLTQKIPFPQEMININIRDYQESSILSKMNLDMSTTT